MRDFSYEEINNMSEESVKQILRDEMLDRANKRVEEERRKEKAKNYINQFYRKKKKSGLLTPTKTL